MSYSLRKFGSWLVRKAAFSVVVVAAGFAVVGLWLFAHDANDYSAQREELIVRRAMSKIAVSVLGDNVARLDTEIAAEVQRVAMADRVITELKRSDNFWDRFVAHPEQQAMNDAQLARTRALKKDIIAHLRELRIARADSARGLAKVDAELVEVDALVEDQAHHFSPARHYARAAWRLGRCYVVIALAVCLFGPTLFFLACYYLLAPWVTRGRSLRLAEAKASTLTVSASQPTLENAVWPGEVLLVRKNFTASVDDGLTRRTRAVLSWRFPFSSLLCGLGGLTEVRNVRSAGGRSVVIAGREGEGIEFTRIDVPESGSLVVRPSLVAAVLCASGRAPDVRRHWRIFCWQSWAAGQFRFFEFAGPCRVILATREALRAEVLGQSSEVGASSARVRLEAVAGFTPTLECHPVRAVSFWRYYIGETALFEAGFFGAGLVVQATGADCKALIWRGVLKLFGL